MALTKNQKSLCNKLVSDFNSLVAPGKAAKGAVNAATNAMKSKLNGMAWSNPTDLGNALDAYRDSVADNLPGDQIDDLNEIKYFIDNCDYLSSLSPVSAVIGMITGIFNTIDSLINDLDLTFPEFSAGGLGSLIDKILNGINIPGGDKIADLLALADQLLECLQASCGPEYSGVYDNLKDELENVYEGLGVVSDPNDPNYGKFDYSAMYNDLGLSTPEINAINSVKGGINTSKDASTSAISNTVNAIKTATKGGLF